MVAISAYNTTVLRGCEILLQLVDTIAMVKKSCSSIDFCCNCVVLLQLHLAELHLVVTVATIFLGCNNFQ